MKKLSQRLLLIAIAAALSGTAARALPLPLLSYVPSSDGTTDSAPYAGSAVGSAFAPTVDNSGVTGGDFTFGPGLAQSAATDPAYFPQIPYHQGATSFGAVFIPTSLSSAVSNAAYLTFSITPTAGNSVTLTDIDFSNINFFEDGQSFTYDIEATPTGFGTDAGNILATYVSPSDNTGAPGTDVSLPTLSFAGLTGTTEFRIYMYETNGVQNDTVAGIQGDSLGASFTVNGVVTPALTPEPATYALLGLGLATLMVTVRNRRSANC